jgi:hypothetical protein
MIFNNLSTFSALGINCDRNLSKTKKILWLLLNYLNNICQNRLKVGESYKIYLSAKRKMKLSTSIDVTPARLLSNLFWNQIDYKLLEKTLNNKLHVLEVGCGSGKYRDEIRKNYSELICLTVLHNWFDHCTRFAQMPHKSSWSES